MSRVLKVAGIVLAMLALVVLAAWLKLRGPEIPYADLEAKYAGAGSGYVEGPDGSRLHYQESGAAGAPPVVLLHGYGDSFTSWERFAPVLAQDYRVIALDLPGHGLTREPEGFTLTTAALVAAVDRLAAARGLGPFALVGNSMGGGVAWNYALAHPQRLSALVLVDAAGWPQKPSGPLPVAFRILKYPIGRWLLAHIDNRPLIEQGLRADVYDPAVITPAFIDRWAQLQRAPGHRAILMSVSPAAFATATPELLGAIHVPTLVLHGANDTLIPVANAHDFAAAIQGATLTVFPHVGHLPQVEIPEESAREVAAFLAAHRPAP